VFNQKGFIAYLVTSLLIISVLIIGCDTETSSSKPRLEIGQEGIIDCGGSTCAIAVTEEAWREHRKALNAKDAHGTAALLMTGRLFTVEKGARALVIDYNSGTALTKIRILQGKGEGLAGWVPYEHITK
jgi:hypothetical protein